MQGCFESKFEGRIMKYLVGIALTLQFFCSTVLAAGYSTFAVPTRIEVERGEGFAIYGDFGNPGGCSGAYSNVLFVRSSSPHYKEMYAATLAAFAGKYRISAYVVNCQTITWYANSPDTLNMVDTNSVLRIMD
jgi:hypothetical protein